MIKKVGNWGGSRSVRLETEMKELGIEKNDKVKVIVQDNKIIIEKKVNDFKTNNGIAFKIKD